MDKDGLYLNIPSNILNSCENLYHFIFLPFPFFKFKFCKKLKNSYV